MARSVREIDRNEDKYVGIRFPLDHSPEGFFYKTKTVLEQSKANLQNLLLTTPGERIFQPEFGSQLKSIVFEQGVDVPNRIEEAIRSAVDSIKKAGVSIEQVPEDVQNALTRDYSGLMKAIDKKKKGEGNYRP